MNVQILRMDCPRKLLIGDAGLDAISLVDKVVIVSLAAAVVEHLALASVRIIEETAHS